MKQSHSPEANRVKNSLLFIEPEYSSVHLLVPTTYRTLNQINPTNAITPLSEELS
jgi:hypothetical protein